LTWPRYLWPLVAACCAGVTLAGAGEPHFSSELRFNAFGYRHDSEREADNSAFESDLRLDVSGSRGDHLRYRVVPQVRFDTTDRSDPWTIEWEEDGADRPLLTVHEAVLAWYGDRVEWVVGKQFFDWGSGDGFKPADNLNPYDWVDLPIAEKIGVSALSLYRFGESFDAQLVLVPWFTPARLPAADNRWLPSDAPLREAYRRAVGSDPVVVDGGHERPAHATDTIQAAARLASSTLVTGWDLALTFYSGHDSIGVLRTDAVPPDLVVTRVHPAYTEVGLSVATTLGEWSLHAEAAWHDTDERMLDDDYIEYVAGLNRTWYAPLANALERITLSLEYAGETVTRSRPADSPYTGAAFARGLTGAVLGHIELQWTERVGLEIAGAVNVEAGDFRVKPSLAYEPVDGVELEAGIDIFEGPCDSFFGGWDRNDRVYLLATVRF